VHAVHDLALDVATDGAHVLLGHGQHLGQLAPQAA
jgi:hypothetical protein